MRSLCCLTGCKAGIEIEVAPRRREGRREGFAAAIDMVRERTNVFLFSYYSCYVVLFLCSHTTAKVSTTWLLLVDCLARWTCGCLGIGRVLLLQFWESILDGPNLLLSTLRHGHPSYPLETPLEPSLEREREREVPTTHKQLKTQPLLFANKQTAIHYQHHTQAQQLVFAPLEEQSNNGGRRRKKRR